MDTIFALSSGSLPSGVAVIRITGDGCGVVMDEMLQTRPAARVATLASLCDPTSREVLDRVLAIWFPAPASFTGDDVLELHCHGGVATITAILDTLSGLPHCRMAAAGEFSRRAFENGKMDLTQLEGLADVLAAQTLAQLRQANDLAAGGLKSLCERWRADLIRIRSFLEAEIDFSDEGDVEEAAWDTHRDRLEQLEMEMKQHLNDANRGRIVREGLKVVLAGPPNAGKSSLLNALAKDEVAIVSPQAGTTRDVIETHLNIDGFLVRVSDTAGLHDSDDEVERIGMKRSREAMSKADLVLWLQPCDEPPPRHPPQLPDHARIIGSKSDLVDSPATIDVTFSCATLNGVQPVVDLISEVCSERVAQSGSPDAGVVLSRQRHRECVSTAVNHVAAAMEPGLDAEFVNEHLRLASHNIGQLVGHADVEDLLDVIFNEFCIGK
ncbi:MAG: tRNA uridine-5-carboxymethylaminomethyl(34) synthesis GTPase MnmE [Ahrensia sp.]|nr:tRNA uridine-5-carboxymethylaminomethyl(34) synthesis GTPase MnmE [Ahrensia sp.]